MQQFEFKNFKKDNSIKNYRIILLLQLLQFQFYLDFEERFLSNFFYHKLKLYSKTSKESLKLK